jgi:hypothetical protein
MVSVLRPALRLIFGPARGKGARAHGRAQTSA